MGLFYAKPEARRKWLYALIAVLISLLVLAQIFFELTQFMRIRELHFETVENGLVVNILEVTLWVFLGLHILSFVDVIGACYIRRRSYHGTRKETWEKIQTQGVEQAPLPVQMRKTPTSIKFSASTLRSWIMSPFFAFFLGILPIFLLGLLKASEGISLWSILAIVWLILAFIAAYVLSAKNERSISPAPKEKLALTDDEPTNPDSKT
jgi:uncharacterized membrane protein